MGLLDGVTDVVIEEALKVLPSWGWAIAGVLTFSAFIGILFLTKRPKLVMVGTTIAGITSFFLMKGFILPH